MNLYLERVPYWTSILSYPNLGHGAQPRRPVWERRVMDCSGYTHLLDQFKTAASLILDLVLLRFLLKCVNKTLSRALLRCRSSFQ